MRLNRFATKSFASVLVLTFAFSNVTFSTPISFTNVKAEEKPSFLRTFASVHNGVANTRVSELDAYRLAAVGRSELRQSTIRTGFENKEVKTTHSFASFNIGNLLGQPLNVLPKEAVDAVRAYLQKAYDKQWLKGVKVVDLTASHIQVHVSHNYGENNADVHRLLIEAVRTGLEKMKKQLNIDPTKISAADLVKKAQVTFADHSFKERAGVSESVEVAMGLNVDISAFNNTAYELFGNLDFNPASTLSSDRIRGYRFYIQKRDDILNGITKIKVLEVSEGDNGEPDVNQLRKIKILIAQNENIVTAVYPVQGRAFKDATEPLMTVTFQPAFGSNGKPILNPIAIFRAQSGGPAVGAIGHSVAHPRYVVGGPEADHYVAVRPFSLKEARKPIKEKGIGGFVMYGYEQAGNGYMPRNGYISDYFGLSKTFLHAYIKRAREFAAAMVAHTGFQPYLHPRAAAKKAEAIRGSLNDRFQDVVKDFEPDPFHAEVNTRVESGELVIVISGKGDYGAENGHTRAHALFTAVQRSYLQLMKEKGLIDDYFTLGQDPTKKMERVKLEQNYAAGDDTHMSIVIKAKTNDKHEIETKLANAQTILKRAMALGGVFVTLAFKDSDQPDKPGIGTYGPFQDLVGSDLEKIKKDPFGWLGFAEEGTERFFELANQLADKRDIKAGVIASLENQWKIWKAAGGKGNFEVDRGATGNTSAQGIGIAQTAFDPKADGGFAELDADKMGPQAFNILFAHAMNKALPEYKNGLIAEVWDLKAFDENDNIAKNDLPKSWSDISYLVLSARKAKEPRITAEDAEWLEKTAYQNGDLATLAASDYERLGNILKEIGFVPSKRIFMDVEKDSKALAILLGDSDRYNVKAVWDKKKSGWDAEGFRDFLDRPIVVSTVSRLGLLAGGEYVGKDDPKKQGRIQFMKHIFDYLAENLWMLQGDMNGSHQLGAMTLPVDEAIATLNSAPIAVGLIYRMDENGNITSVEDVFKQARFQKRAKVTAEFNLNFISAQRATNPHLAHREQVEGAYAIEAISRALDNPNSPYSLDKLLAQKPGEYAVPVSADANTLYSVATSDQATAYQQLSRSEARNKTIRLIRRELQAALEQLQIEIDKDHINGPVVEYRGIESILTNSPIFSQKISQKRKISFTASDVIEVTNVLSKIFLRLNASFSIYLGEQKESIRNAKQRISNASQLFDSLNLGLISRSEARSTSSQPTSNEELLQKVGSVRNQIGFRAADVLGVVGVEASLDAAVQALSNSDQIKARTELEEARRRVANVPTDVKVVLEGAQKTTSLPEAIDVFLKTLDADRSEVRVAQIFDDLNSSKGIPENVQVSLTDSLNNLKKLYVNNFSNVSQVSRVSQVTVAEVMASDLATEGLGYAGEIALKALASNKLPLFFVKTAKDEQLVRSIVAKIPGGNRVVVINLEDIDEAVAYAATVLIDQKIREIEVNGLTDSDKSIANRLSASALLKQNKVKVSFRPYKNIQAFLSYLQIMLNNIFNAVTAAAKQAYSA